MEIFNRKQTIIRKKQQTNNKKKHKITGKTVRY